MKRLLCGLFILLAAIATASAWTPGGAQENAPPPQVHVARLEGRVDGSAARYVERVISDAQEAGANAVVLELDTPGGSLEATQRIVEAESNAEQLAVIAYVSPRGAQAASAGTFSVTGSDIAAMAPQTRLGAATPILATGQDIPGDLGEKAVNDAAAFLTELARSHGRNEEWAESAVREAASIGAGEALEIGVVEYVEPDLRSLLTAADGERVEPKGITPRLSGAQLVEKPMTFRERHGVPLWVLPVAAILAVAFIVRITMAAVKTSRWKVSTGSEGMVGDIGTVRRAVSGGPAAGGLVFVHGERWRAIPENGERIEVGEEVEVVGFRGSALVVRPVRDR